MSNKTIQTGADVGQFVSAIDDPHKRADAETLVALMREVTGQAPAMWGPSIVGFGHRHYRYASGREGDTFLIGFSPRKQNLTLYLSGYLDQYHELLAQLGKHSTGKGCLYLKRLGDADPAVLRRVLKASASSVND